MRTTYSICTVPQFEILRKDSCFPKTGNRPTSSAIIHGVGGGGRGDVAVLHVLRTGEEVVERVAVADAEELEKAQELDLRCLWLQVQNLNSRSSIFFFGTEKGK